MIYLQFVAEHTVGSFAIRWFGGGAKRAVSHVDAVMPDGDLLGARSDRAGQKPPGVEIRPSRYRRFYRRIIVSLPCSEQQQELFYSFLLKQIGKPYDHTAVMAFFVSRDWREDNCWICSELQAAALEFCGILPYLYLTPNLITPTELALLTSVIPGASFQECCN